MDTPILNESDTLRFRLSASRTVSRSSVSIAVEVVALVDAQDCNQEALESRVLAALARFVETHWTISSIERSQDDSGYERVLLRAHARVAPNENHNLAERGRRASGTGLAIQNPSVDYALEPSVLVDETNQLQDELVLAAQARAQRFTELTQRKWRIGDIRFGLNADWQENYSPKRVVRESATAYSEGGLGMAERLLLLAEVTLKSSAA